MKCLIKDCGSEIDETRAFPDVVVGGKSVPDAVNAFRHAEELSIWEQLSVTVSRGGLATVMVGHICPAHDLDGVKSLALEVK
jgi:hypothetical protein